MVETLKSFTELKAENPNLTTSEYSRSLIEYRKQKAVELGISLEELHQFTGRIIVSETQVIPVPAASSESI